MFKRKDFFYVLEVKIFKCKSLMTKQISRLEEV